MVDVVANGVRHHVQRLGAGVPPVVFVHGLVMDNLSSFYFTLANPVAARTEAILYDLRGHGGTEIGASVEHFMDCLYHICHCLVFHHVAVGSGPHRA